MERCHAQPQTCINWRVLVLLAILILLAYSNTFHSSWHLDDFYNITRNPRIQISQLNPETLYNAAFENKESNKIFYRPAAYLSFALNWYFGQNDVTGYHIVNILIHITTAFFLYLTVLALFNSPNLSGSYEKSQYFIAALAAVLWAVNPIHTQAVTYIVQRMTCMSALFYIIGLYLYINARFSSGRHHRILLYAGVFMAFLLAVGSKENAFMFPVSLFLMEMVFFKNLNDRRTRKRLIWIGGILAISLFALGVMLFMGNGFITRLQEGYANRTFTLTERLLTQPRIVVFYISQIFYPIAERLSIVHDFEVSSGLFRPWTTLPAIFLVLGAVATAFWKIKKNPLICFAVLFFFVNHVIESSVIPLELVFEHRNYLPSLFLFVPVAAGLKWAIDYYQKEKRFMAAVFTIFVTILTSALGFGTYVRNEAWANETTLWQDALNKAPGSARPYHNLSAGHYTMIGDYDSVEALCARAMDLYGSTRNKAKVLSLENMANVYAKRDKDYEKVIKLYKKVLDLNPDRANSRYHMVLAMIQTGHLNEALENISKLTSQNPQQSKYLNTKAFILIKKQQPKRALHFLITAMANNPDDEKTNLNLGILKSMMQKYESAEHFLSKIPVQSPKKTTALLLQIENYVRAGVLSKAEKYAQKLIARTGPQKISETIQKSNKPGLTWPISAELVVPVIADVLRKQSQNMTGLLKTATDES